MFKVNNKDTRTTPLCSSGSIVKCEHVFVERDRCLLFTALPYNPAR